MIKNPGKSEKRTEQEIRMHYEIEKSLASKLRNASKDERCTLYTSLYEELYRRVPNHPQLTQKKCSEQQLKAVNKQMDLLEDFLDKNKSFLEVGPGDCALAFHATKFTKEVYAVDVSTTVTESFNIPNNFKLLISNGCNIPVPNNSIDIIYSDQLMEHLHPDDAHDQLKNIHLALAPRGVYLCCTPSRLNGPHDVSYYFDTVATGFHLMEYTITDLSKLFKKAGFKYLTIYIRTRGKYVEFPISVAIWCERVLELLPRILRQFLVTNTPFKKLMKIRLTGLKSDYN